jgi:release factor glutamine methyltransferase
MVIDIDKHIQLSYDNVKKNEALAPVHTFEHDERFYIGLNTVFSPIIFQDAFFFSENIPTKIGGSFLEVGCGSGFIAVNAAFKGYEKVVATDINPAAIRNTKINALLHHVDHQLTAFVSDVFDGIDTETCPPFDTIFWNTPFINEGEKAISALEKSVFANYTQGLTKYVSMAKSFLTPQGRVFIGFSSTCGDMDLLNTICEQNNAFLVLTAQHPIFEITLELYEIIYT